MGKLLSKRIVQCSHNIDNVNTLTFSILRAARCNIGAVFLELLVLIVDWHYSASIASLSLNSCCFLHQETYENFVKVNNGKNLFRSARTPAVFFVILIILYVLQEIFQMFGLEVLGKICGLTLGLILFVLCFWAYTR